MCVCRCVQCVKCECVCVGSWEAERGGEGGGSSLQLDTVGLVCVSICMDGVYPSTGDGSSSLASLAPLLPQTHLSLRLRRAVGGILDLLQHLHLLLLRRLGRGGRLCVLECAGVSMLGTERERASREVCVCALRVRCARMRHVHSHRAHHTTHSDFRRSNTS